MRMLGVLLLPALAWAQTAPVPPPPSLPTSEAGVRTTLLDDREPAPPDAPPATRREEPPLPEKITEPPSPEAAPTVSIRTDRSGDVVEEYRQNGRIYMVKVRPMKGVPYSLLDSNGDGQLDQHDGEGPVRPVYYTLYEWN